MPENKKPEAEPTAEKRDADELPEEELDKVAGGGVGTTPSSRKEGPEKPGVPINF